MRKNILRVIAVIFLISIFVIGIAVLTACKKEEPKGPIYKLNEDNMTCSIERNADFVPEGDFIIPSIYEGKAVTKISENAFQNCTDLTSVTIPNSVVSIGKNAFNGCRSLTEVVIPSSVTNIGYGAFSVCSALRNITIPSSVTDIEEMVLERCYSLENVTVPYKLLPNLKKELAQIENLTISLQDDGVTEIEGCFRGYQHLKNVSIPESVTVIGDSTFRGCSNLIDITIPSNVSSIGKNAFSGCSNLVSINIPNNVTSIGSGAFCECTNLTNVIIPDSVTTIGGFCI